MEKTAFNIENLEHFRENNKLEAKKAVNGVPNSMWETYSAFANTEGGVIILGIEEMSNHKLAVIGINDVHQCVCDIWNTLNNAQKVSINILTERMVRVESYDGKDIVVVDVPRAERNVRPVYINHNPENGTYRRNFDGDYHCSKEQISAMYRDAAEITADKKVLKDMDLSVFCKDTIKSYRDRFRAFHSTHLWNNYDDEQFLRIIGAVGMSNDDGKYHPTVAGLLMFGFDYEIVREMPQYFLDYREKFDSSVRWTHRIESSSGDWSGNIYDFFWKVYPRLKQNLPVPFAVKNGSDRIDEPKTHLAIRELFLNCLAHSDYYGRRGVVVVNTMSSISLGNPGDMRVALDVALSGGISDPRNSQIMRMFGLVELGERAGSGMTDAIATFNDELEATVEYSVSLEPERTTTIIKLPKPLINVETVDKPLINYDSVDKTADNPLIKGETVDKTADIFEFIKNSEEVKTSEISSVFGLSMTQSRYYLQRLINSGKVTSVGGNRNRRYRAV